MSTPSDPQPESPAAELERLQLKKARSEVQKLELEIENLQSARNRYIPIVTAIISILGFLSGIFIFTYQQGSDRLSRDQNRFSTGSQELFGFPHQNVGVARALALRRDLDGLIDLIYPTEKRNDIKRDLTTYIHNLISRDCDFTQPRQIQLDIAALQYWDDYKEGCAGQFNLSIIEKYVTALAELHRKDKTALESMKMIDGDAPDPESVIGEPYLSIFKGYMCHYDLIEDDEQKNKVKTRVNTLTNNDTLAQNIESYFKCPTISLLDPGSRTATR